MFGNDDWAAARIVTRIADSNPHSKPTKIAPLYSFLRRAENIKEGKETITPDMRRAVYAAMKRVREKYGHSVGKYLIDWEWGFVNGKRSAFRWVLSDEWNFLDT